MNTLAEASEQSRWGLQAKSSADNYAETMLPI